MPRCNECGINHYTGTLFCKDCGTYLLGQESYEQPFFDMAVKEPFSGISTTPSSDVLTVVPEDLTGLVFVIPSSGRQVEMEADKIIRVGRSDSIREIDPELDLTEDLGVENGVSREHALLQPENQGLSLVDLGSTNGTHLNGRRLPPSEPYPLNNGDTILFGRLLVRVFFES